MTDNANYTPDERELLLTQTAAVRAGDEASGAAVILVPLHRVLCRADEADAKLIVKIFNHTEVTRPTL